MQALRARQPSLPFLVPGIGVQGGVVSIAPAAISSSGGGALLSASRSVLYASSGSDYAVAARGVAERLAGGIRAALRTGMVTAL